MSVTLVKSKEESKKIMKVVPTGNMKGNKVDYKMNMKCST